MRKSTIRSWISQHWRVGLVWAALVAVSVLLFTWRLASMPGEATSAESTYITSVSSAGQLLQSPAFLFHKLLTYTAVKLGAHHIVFFRLVSVAFALGAVFSMYCIIHRWYTKRVAMLGSLLFASSSLVLHAARAATPEVSYLLLVPIIALGLALQSTKRHRGALFVLLGSLCVTVYVPGFIWLAGAVLVWRGRRLGNLVRRISWPSKLLCVGMVLALLAPAIVAVAHHPRELFTVAGLPTHMENVGFYVHRLGSTLAALVWQYNDVSSSQWVRGTAIFDVFTLAMIVLGAYSLRYSHALMRGRLQAGLSLLFWLLIVTAGPVTFVALTPVLYLLAAGGIAFMLQQWFAVFPRNPIARSVAVGLVCLSVGLCSYFHMYRYFVAWPYTSQTKSPVTQSYLVN